VRYFTPDEFDCECCGRNSMDGDFLKKIDEARERAGIPFVVTSGYRCPQHNSDVGGVPDSAHVWGVAADISCTSSRNRMLIVKAALASGFTRIGIGDDFVHLDLDEDLPQNVIWTY